MQRGRAHDKLEARLGYRFADPDLLDRALTHASALAPTRRIAGSNQRLEFLGDRVLDLVVADLLYRRFEKADEGDLNRSLVTLVRGETCAAIARSLDIGPELRMGEGERRSGASDNDAILGDAMEAILAAVYLDGGLGQAYALLERLLGDQLDIARSQRLDPKTTLQEWAQAQGMEPPSYVVEDQSGPAHAPEFTMSVAVDGYEPTTGSGPSKKLAEHKAAEKFLIRQKVWRETR